MNTTRGKATDWYFRVLVWVGVLLYVNKVLAGNRRPNAVEGPDGESGSDPVNFTDPTGLIATAGAGTWTGPNSQDEQEAKNAKKDSDKDKGLTEAEKHQLSIFLKASMGKALSKDDLKWLRELGQDALVKLINNFADIIGEMVDNCGLTGVDLLIYQIKVGFDFAQMLGNVEGDLFSTTNGTINNCIEDMIALYVFRETEGLLPWNPNNPLTSLTPSQWDQYMAAVQNLANGRNAIAHVVMNIFKDNKGDMEGQRDFKIFYNDAGLRVLAQRALGGENAIWNNCFAAAQNAFREQFFHYDPTNGARFYNLRVYNNHLYDSNKRILGPQNPLYPELIFGPLYNPNGSADLPQGDCAIVIYAS